MKSTHPPWASHGLPTDMLTETPRNVHEQPMGAPWGVHGCLIGCLRSPHAHSMNTPWTPMDTPWAPHGHPVGAPRTSTRRPIGCPYAAHGHPMDFPRNSRPCALQGYPTSAPRTSHGHRTDTPRVPHGRPMNTPWISHGRSSWGVGGQPTIPWAAAYGVCVDLPWETRAREVPVVCP